MSCEHCEREVYARGICKKHYDKEQYAKHRDKRRASSKASHARRKTTPEGRASILAIQRRYREDNREAVRESNRAYEQRTREKMGDEEYRAYKARLQREHTGRMRAIVHEAKAVPCKDCGVQYPPQAMDLHHRDPATKKYNLAAVSQMGEPALRTEIAKCDVLCANCHRLRHARIEAA